MAKVLEMLYLHTEELQALAGHTLQGEKMFNLAVTPLLAKVGGHKTTCIGA